MRTFTRRFPILLSILVIAVTIVFVALALVTGRAVGAEAPVVEIGRLAPQDFVATGRIEVVDDAATEAERNRARINTPDVYTIDPTVKPAVNADLLGFFAAIRGAAFEEPQEPLPTTTTSSEPPITTTTEATGGDDSTTTTDESAPTTTTVTTTLPPPTTTLPPTTTTLPRVPIEDQITEVKDGEFFRFGSDVDALVEFYNEDLDRIADNEPELFPIVEAAIIDIVGAQMDEGIRQAELSGTREQFVVFALAALAILDEDRRDVIESAAARIASDNLRVNEFPNAELTEAARQRAEEDTPDQVHTFFPNDTIVAEGELVGQVAFDAIDQLQLLVPEETTSRLAITVLGALAVLLAAFFLWRIAPGQWSEPKHFALLGVLLVLAALVSRMPELIVPEETPELAFVIPAVMFGYIAAILYDPRTAVVMSVPLAAFIAISTQDAALTMYAAAATIAPVAFVSSVSSRRELRVAVGLSAMVLAPLAGAVAWLFIGSESAWLSALFGLVGGLIAGLVAQGLLSFLENLFRITTTVTLLDLTDRNHPALRLLEEKAPGTFNHSILVGALAGKAARAIGADPLLAEAAAYYHDLGKTENPRFFIENQFGFFNPHDELAPEVSAEIIRSHVSEGLRLARQFRIPDDIADGIRMHHGVGLMRYFYHKALDADPGVDSSLYRHNGVKPRRKEMAILMVSDAVEGAARALAHHEDPTADGLSKLVDSVVNEKLEDGQLDESALTFGELTRVKLALVEALIAYYHTRIPYPGFPTGPGGPPALGPGEDDG